MRRFMYLILLLIGGAPPIFSSGLVGADTVRSGAKCRFLCRRVGTLPGDPFPPAAQNTPKALRRGQVECYVRLSPAFSGILKRR